MSSSTLHQPLAQALLHHLADSRPGKDDPVGSFARTVLNGEASLRAAASFSWHGNGLAEAASKAEEERRGLPSDERRSFESDALRIREIERA
ncbi:hypothetical protein [Actinoplanes sp. HUAS TT8]|uniref:hypothetical protein n=1 Tax=Actinoplanes sp. HUAS TT8 TaxID=3447453 RepID=UPI003F51E3FC